MKFFPKLAQREGLIELPDGRALVVKLLPVRFLDAYFDVLEECGDGAEAQATGRKRLREIIRNVWPEEHMEILYHFDYAGTAKLCNYLFFGDQEDTEKRTAGGKNGDTFECDLEFVAARILNAFPGYTLEALLNEPVGVFFRLALLAGRIGADNALTMVSAIAAGLGDKTAAKELTERRGSLAIRHSGGTETRNAYTGAELEEALKHMNAKQNIIQTGTRNGKIVRHTEEREKMS